MIPISVHISSFTLELLNAMSKCIIVRSQAHMLGHLTPFLIKLGCIVSANLLEVIIIVHVVSILLTYDFSAFVIEHSLVRCLLHASALVFVHLLSVDQAVASTDGSLSFCLVHLISLLMISLLSKVTL